MHRILGTTTWVGGRGTIWLVMCIRHRRTVGGGSDSNEESTQGSEDLREKRSSPIFQKSRLPIRLVETIVKADALQYVEDWNMYAVVL